MRALTLCLLLVTAPAVAAPAPLPKPDRTGMRDLQGEWKCEYWHSGDGWPAALRVWVDRATISGGHLRCYDSRAHEPDRRAIIRLDTKTPAAKGTLTLITREGPRLGVYTFTAGHFRISAAAPGEARPRFGGGDFIVLSR